MAKAQSAGRGAPAAAVVESRYVDRCDEGSKHGSCGAGGGGQVLVKIGGAPTGPRERTAVGG
jgi:hypothetical protein